MKDVLVKLLKSNWTGVIVLALMGLFSGGVYSDQITQMILSLVGK